MILAVRATLPVLSRVTDWIRPTAHDNPKEWQEERSTNTEQSKRKKKKLISDSKEFDMPLFSVATLSSSDLLMKGERILGRKGNPEGRGGNNPYKQFSLNTFKNLLELDDATRNYSTLQAWQHAMVTLKQKVLSFCQYEKEKILDQTQKNLTCS